MIDTGGWRKSSYSNGSGGACVEVRPHTWRTSSYSNGEGGDCVEVRARGTVDVRDSKRRDAGMLALRPHTWRAFTEAIKRERL